MSRGTQSKQEKGIKPVNQAEDFAKNWWAQRWLQAMEVLLDQGRLRRGRRLARQDQVLSLIETSGQIEAKVQDTKRPFTATIKVDPFSDQAWEQVITTLESHPLFLAQLLSGEVPPDIEEAFTAVALSLFPNTQDDLHMSCNCPDWADVCKHLAAAHYILAERFDEDPFLLFRLRGRSQEAILAALRSRQKSDEDKIPEALFGPCLTVDVFWQIEDTVFSTHIAAPETPFPVLARLGQPDFLEEEITFLLGPAYEMISQEAIKMAFTDVDNEV